MARLKVFQFGEDWFNGAIGIQDADKLFDVRGSAVVGFGFGVLKAHKMDEGDSIRFLVGVVDEGMGFLGFDFSHKLPNGFEALP